MHHKRKFLILSLLLLTCFGLMLIGIYSTVQLHKKQQLSHFNRQADDTLWKLQQHIHWQLESVSNTAALIHAVRDINHETFKKFTAPILEKHPSIQALEWIPKVFHEQRTVIEKSAQQYHPGFHFTEKE